MRFSHIYTTMSLEIHSETDSHLSWFSELWVWDRAKRYWDEESLSEQLGIGTDSPNAEAKSCSLWFLSRVSDLRTERTSTCSEQVSLTADQSREIRDAIWRKRKITICSKRIGGLELSLRIQMKSVNSDSIVYLGCPTNVQRRLAA